MYLSNGRDSPRGFPLRGAHGHVISRSDRVENTPRASHDVASLEGILSSTSRTGGIHVLNFPPQDQGETLREAMIRSLITLYKQHIAVFQLRCDMSTVYISDNFTSHSSVAHMCA